MPAGQVVIVIDEFDYRLGMAEKQLGVETVNYRTTDVEPELRELLERMARGEITTAYLATHVMPLDEAPRGYELFREKKDDCVRSVFRPDGA